MNTRIVNSLTATVAMMVLLIGAGAFVLSYDALYFTGLNNGVPSAKAWIWPLLIDAPLIVFTLALLVSQIMRQSAKLWAALVILYTLATVGFNLSHAQQSPLGWTVAIVAPVGLLLTTEALRHLAKTIIERQAIVSSMAELISHRDNLANQIDKLTRQSVNLQAQIEAQKSEAEALNLQEILHPIDSLNDARQAKRKEKLNTLLSYLSSNPLASLTEAAKEIGTSRQTVSNYVNELTANGKLSRNGHGWEALK